MFKRIVSAAALAGVLAGLLLTAIQQIEITPLIREAEVQEEATIAASQSAHEHASTGREQEAWAPRRGWERLLASAVSNTVLATGFALLLVSAMSQQKKTGWRAGLLWGTAGYAVFFVAPSLGLPPELRRSLACTNIIENVMARCGASAGTQIYWRSPSMACRAPLAVR